MGNVAVTLKVMPESPQVDLKTLKKKIEEVFLQFEEAKLQHIYEKPIGFGLVALEVLFVVPDSADGTDDIEKAITDINGVLSVDNEGITLI